MHAIGLSMEHAQHTHSHPTVKARSVRLSLLIHPRPAPDRLQTQIFNFLFTPQADTLVGLDRQLLHTPVPIRLVPAIPDYRRDRCRGICTTSRGSRWASKHFYPSLPSLRPPAIPFIRRHRTRRHHRLCNAFLESRARQIWTLLHVPLVHLRLVP